MIANETHCQDCALVHAECQCPGGPTFVYLVPVLLQLRLQAPTEAIAREAASAWQSHASEWDEFANEEEPGEHMRRKDIPRGVYYRDATAFVQSDGALDTWEARQARRARRG